MQLPSDIDCQTKQGMVELVGVSSYFLCIFKG